MIRTRNQYAGGSTRCPRSPAGSSRTSAPSSSSGSCSPSPASPPPGPPPTRSSRSSRSPTRRAGRRTSTIAEHYRGTGGDTRAAAAGGDAARGQDGRLARRARGPRRRSTRASRRRCRARAIASYASTGDERSSPTTAAPPSRSSTRARPELRVRREPEGGEGGAAPRSRAPRSAGAAGAPDRLRRARRGQRRGQRGSRRADRGGARRPRRARWCSRFVFASFLAIVPMLMAIVSIMTTFLLLLGLTELTDVSPIVQFLIALIGLGVAIDYSLIVVSRWREERSHGRSGDEAVQRAMETAGRAVVFSGITVAIGLLALIALPLPFLRSMGYGGMLIPLVSTLVAITLLPVVLAKLGAAARLAAPAHRRQGEPRLDALGRGRRAAPLARGRRGHGRRRSRSSFAATDLQLGTSDADTIAKSGDAKDGPRRARGRRHRRGRAAAARDPGRGRHRPRRRSRPTLREVEGIHGAVAPDDPTGAATAPRSSRRSRCPTAARTRARPRSTACATPRTPPGPDVRVGGQPAVERRLHRRRLRQLPADDRADHDHHVHPAGAGVPLAAAAGEGDRAEHPQRRRGLGRAGARLAARLRLRADLGHRGDRLDPVLDAADDLRVPVRALDGLRGVHPRPDARGVRPHRLDRDRR